MRRYAALLVGLALLTACNAGEEEAPEILRVDEDGDAEIAVSMFDIGYVPESVVISEGATLTVNLTNDGAAMHDFHLEDGPSSDMLASGESDTLEIGPFTESTVAWCTVPGHREAGMEFTIDVQ